MSGHGSLSWRAPRKPLCIDCKHPFITYGPNTQRCDACRVLRKRAIWRAYNRTRRGRADPAVPILDAEYINCFRCKYILLCREIVNTQAPVICQVGDRKRMKPDEIERLKRQPAYLRLADITDSIQSAPGLL